MVNPLEDRTNLSIYAPNIIAYTCIKQKVTELRGEINSNAIIFRDNNTPPLTINESYRESIGNSRFGHY